MAGKRIKCPSCGQVIAVPAAQPASEPKPINPTQGKPVPKEHEADPPSSTFRLSQPVKRPPVPKNTEANTLPPLKKPFAQVIEGNLKPGSKVPRTGTYKCIYCGPTGMGASLLKSTLQSMGLPYTAPLLATKKPPHTFFSEGDIFPSCPNCKADPSGSDPTGWTFESKKEFTGEKGASEVDVTYMEVPGNDKDGLCSDDSCPCGSPGARIPRGEGFIYVSKDVAEFRKDCPTVAQTELKIQRMQQQLGGMIFAGSGVFRPILMCELGAKKRGIDMEIAAADARHWWNTGQVPIRRTPLAGEETALRRPGDPQPPPFVAEVRCSKCNALLPKYINKLNCESCGAISWVTYFGFQFTMAVLLAIGLAGVLFAEPGGGRIFFYVLSALGTGGTGFINVVLAISMYKGSKKHELRPDNFGQKKVGKKKNGKRSGISGSSSAGGPSSTEKGQTPPSNTPSPPGSPEKSKQDQLVEALGELRALLYMQDHGKKPSLKVIKGWIGKLLGQSYAELEVVAHDKPALKRLLPDDGT